MAQMVPVLSRATTDHAGSMWGKLYEDTATGELAGWLVDSWTESHVTPPEHLSPKLHWVSKENGNFYHVRLSIGNFGSRDSMEVFDEDTKIEPQRAAFVRKMLERWEREYLEELEKKRKS